MRTCVIVGAIIVLVVLALIVFGMPSEKMKDTPKWAMYSGENTSGRPMSDIFGKWQKNKPWIGSLGANLSFEVPPGLGLLPADLIEAQTLPKTFLKWKDDGWLRPIKNQGNCGSCWAHAIVECLEDAWAIHNADKNFPSLSVQYVISCTLGKTDFSQYGGLPMNGCGGGFVLSGIETISQSGPIKGTFLDSMLPYENTNFNYKGGNPESAEATVKCDQLQFRRKPDGTNNTKYGYTTTYMVSWMPQISGKLYGMPLRDLPANLRQQRALLKQENILRIKSAVSKYGPVPAAYRVYADFQSLNQTPNRIYKHEWGGYQGGHAILIVGWDYDRDTGEEYWVVQNSWGPQWGLKGFWKHSMADEDCLIEHSAVFGFVNSSSMYPNASLQG